MYSGLNHVSLKLSTCMNSVMFGEFKRLEIFSYLEGQQERCLNILRALYLVEELCHGCVNIHWFNPMISSMENQSNDWFI